MLRKKSALITAFLVIFTSIIFYGFSDERKENIDIIIALDKSLSMVEEINAVKGYINENIVDQLIIPGDYLLIIGFYGKTNILVSKEVDTPEDKQRVKSIISKVQADGHFTDIGNALDEVKRQFEKYSNDNRRKYVLLITDGKQEAPPTSKYYSPDGKFNHEFLKNTKTIQKKGWKIQVLGIGTETAAKELAKQLSGEYTEVSKNPTKQEITSKTQNLLSSITLVGKPESIKINSFGIGKISLKLKSSGYEKNRVITIENIFVESSAIPKSSILAKSITEDVMPSGETKISIPIKLERKTKPGNYNVTLEFIFHGNIRFLPSVFETSLHVSSFIESFLWIFIVIAVIILAAIVFVILKLTGLAGTKVVRFRIIIEESPLQRGKDIFSVKAGSFLYLNEGSNMVSVTGRKTLKSIAKFTARNTGLTMQVLKEERFLKADKIPENILGWSFIVRSESGRDLHVRIEAVS